MTPAERARFAISGAALQQSYGKLGAGLGAAGLAGSVGFSAELGALTLNPYTAIPAALLLIGEVTGLIPSLSGKPKLLDTAQAIQRLARSNDPAVQQLAQNFAIYLKNGVPLSTSNPQQQAQIRNWVGGAVQTILQRQGIPATPQTVGQLDTAIRNVITSEVANPGTAIDRSVAQLRKAYPGGPNPPSVPGLYAQRGTTLGTLARRVAGRFPTTPAQLRQDLERLPEVGKGIELSRQLPGSPEYLANLGSQLGQEIGGLLTGGQPAPLLDDSKVCLSCTPQGRKLLAQQGRLKQDIQREQEQLTEQQLSQQAQQLSHFEDLEKQPAEQRDIPQELQQKQMLAQQIEQELQNVAQPGSIPTSTGRALPIEGQPGAPLLTEPEHPHLISECPPGQHMDPNNPDACVPDAPTAQPITFCVGCKSQEDAILFLNGEPSECSVIPGSTKELPNG